MKSPLSGRNDHAPLLSERGTYENNHYAIVNRLRRGLVFKAHRLLYYSTLGLRVVRRRRFKTVKDNSGLDFRKKVSVVPSSLGVHFDVPLAPTVGSRGGAVSYERDTPVTPLCLVNVAHVRQSRPDSGFGFGGGRFSRPHFARRAPRWASRSSRP